MSPEPGGPAAHREPRGPAGSQAPADLVPFDPVRVRRLLTGTDGNGRAVVLSDGEAPSVVGGDGRSGLQVVALWQTRTTPPALSGEDPADLPHQLEPVAAGIHWRVVVFPERREEGFTHRTDTLDMLYLVSGRVILGVGDDADSMHDVELAAGDAVVALANVHRWRNPGPGPCVAVASMISATPRQNPT